MVMPLDDVKVLDFTRMMAGPYGTLILADYGADVIKIESMPNGDGARTIGEHFHDGESAVFLMWNRGKRSLALNLRDNNALEVIHRLVSDADVIVENYRPGVADEIGIGYDKLSLINPGLVYVSVSAFGPEGPLAPYPGTDPVVQAMSGVMSVTGEADGDPLLVGVPVADFTGALLGAQAVLLGILARNQTGRGQKIDVSMLFGLMSSLTTRLASHWATGGDPRPMGAAHSVVVPYERFATSDGYVVAGVWGDDGWGTFCDAVGLPELIDDERFSTNQRRLERRPEITKILQDRFLELTTAEWQERFYEKKVLFAPVLGFTDILSHPQVADAGIVQEVRHSRLGDIPQLGPVIGLSETPGMIRRPPPVFGEHTIEVLVEAGWTEQQARRLCEDGVAFDASVPS